MDFGVATPYAGQVRSTRMTFRKAGLDDIAVGTTDYWQVKEKPIMIVDLVCVRATTKGLLAFSQERNVSMSYSPVNRCISSSWVIRLALKPTLPQSFGPFTRSRLWCYRYRYNSPCLFHHQSSRKAKGDQDVGLRATDFGGQSVFKLFFPIYGTLLKLHNTWLKQHGHVAEIDLAPITEKYVIFYKKEGQEVDYSGGLGNEKEKGGKREEEETKEQEKKEGEDKEEPAWEMRQPTSEGIDGW
ncbi:MAG: hypothetical protein Q9161_002409 [Pseudevernia consocians]